MKRAFPDLHIDKKLFFLSSTTNSSRWRRNDHGMTPMAPSPNQRRLEKVSELAQTICQMVLGSEKVGPNSNPQRHFLPLTNNLVTKIKKGLIEKAKIKKEYAKVKATEEKKNTPAEPASTGKNEAAEAEDQEEAEPQVHPERQAMLEEDKADAPKHNDEDSHAGPRQRRPRQQRKPGYFDKALAQGGQKKAEAEAREQARQQRNEDRKRKLAERERYRRAVVKARAPGRDGQRKLGRQSGLLLEKVKRIVGDGK